jgi:hypothetical protein
MARRIYPFVALAVMLWPALAQGWMVMGPGGVSCGQWTKDRATNREEGYADASWVLGFLSGYNFIAKGTDSSGAFAWIDNYCAQHPLNDLSDATIALVEELSKRTVP